MITHSEYMADSKNLHHRYYLQFATKQTYHFVMNQIGIELLKKSTDPHFNDIIRHTNGAHWIWDQTPCNVTLMREAGAVSKGYLPSDSMCTCVGKAVARDILDKLEKEEAPD